MAIVQNTKLRKINHGLSLVAIILAIYIIVIPFLPELKWWASHLFTKPNLAVVQVAKPAAKARPTTTKAVTPVLVGRWLDIPRLNMHQEIYTGSLYQLNLGVWHIPSTSTPNNGGNTVVAGHRFTYTNPQGVFYFLDKIQLDDRITVGWDGTEYTYQVINIEVVPPTDLSVEAPSSDDRFTLYTCTPLLTAANRLVVQAQLVSRATL